MAQRILSDFISAYLEYTKETEPKSTYHIWCAISAIAAALERKVYIVSGHQHIYSNFYTVLVGPAGWARKGTAIDLIRPIIEKADVKTMTGAITMEKLSQRLKGALETFSDPYDGLIKFQCAVTFISPELQVFLREKNVDLLARLTDLYDCPDTWVYDTKNSGTDYVQGAYFNILAATAPDWIRSMLPDPAVGGGFTRRIIWVVEEDKRTKSTPTVDETLQEKLINDLQTIGLLTGPAKFTDEAWQRYVSWYEEHDRAYREGDLAIADPRFAGYCATRATLLRKLALVCSVSESSALIIEAKHFDRAKQILEHTERKMPRAFKALGQARYSTVVEQIFNFVLKKGEVYKKEILLWMWRDIDEASYNIAVHTLLKMEVIELLRDSNGKEYISLKPGVTEQQFFGG
jgi:hypothetical protein